MVPSEEEMLVGKVRGKGHRNREIEEKGKRKRRVKINSQCKEMEARMGRSGRGNVSNTYVQTNSRMCAKRCCEKGEERHIA